MSDITNSIRLILRLEGASFTMTQCEGPLHFWWQISARHSRMHFILAVQLCEHFLTDSVQFIVQPPLPHVWRHTSASQCITSQLPDMQLCSHLLEKQDIFLAPLFSALCSQCSCALHVISHEPGWHSWEQFFSAMQLKTGTLLKQFGGRHFWSQLSNFGSLVVLHLHSSSSQDWEHWLEDVSPPLQEASVVDIPHNEHKVKMRLTSTQCMSNKQKLYRIMVTVIWKALG